MTEREAMQIIRSFEAKSAPGEDEAFLYTEALRFLIDKNHDPRYMLVLGGYYYEIRKFDLALKYYELAAENKYEPAYDALGYIWYYGRTGQRDYEKAFKYFSLSKDCGNIQAAYKLADMYKNGYYVDRDYEKYKSIIEELYPKVAGARYLDDPLPEIFTRLAKIRSKEGKTEEAIDLYLRAKDFLAQRIKYNAFFGNLNIMMWLIDDLYSLKGFDRDEFDFYDIYHLLNSPCTIKFRRGSRTYVITVSKEDDGVAIEFGGNWYRTREDFFQKAVIGGDKLTAVYDQFYAFEVT